MMPDNVLSGLPGPQEFLAPDNRVFDSGVDYELGGIALNNASQGLQYQVWKAQLVGNNIVVSAETTGFSVPIIPAPNAKFISLAFDRNMNVQLAWQADGAAHLYWYDTLSASYKTTSFPGARSPRLTHDDKRKQANAWSDVLLFFARGTKFYVLNQRDRYTVEHELGTLGTDEDVVSVGMTTLGRIQVVIQGRS